MSTLAGISVIIPNYNGKELLPQMLPTVFKALKKSGQNSEIIVADDCSVDESVILLREKFPEIKIVINETNSGFSVTANKGIAAAKFDWVLLLNSDVKLEEDYFIPLLKYTEQADVFGVMGRIIGWQDDKIQDGAKYPLFHGVKIKTSGNYLLKNKEDMSNGLYSMYLSGANTFLNKKIFLAIGGFNELFSPFYIEDVELSIRAWRAGYTCYYNHDAICRHKTSSTVLSGNTLRAIQEVYSRNKMYLHAIHLSHVKRIIWFLQVFFEAVAYILILKWSYIHSLIHFFKNYKKVIISRNQLKQIGKNKKLLTFSEVIDKIEFSIKGKELIRF